MHLFFYTQISNFSYTDYMWHSALYKCEHHQVQLWAFIIIFLSFERDYLLWVFFCETSPFSSCWITSQVMSQLILVIHMKQRKKNRTPFPRCTILHVALTFETFSSQKSHSHPCAQYDYTSKIKWSMTKGREERRMFHSNISRELLCLHE